MANIESYAPSTNLCSLSEWSIQHIRDIFEAPSDESALRAISSTFSEDLHASVNGSSLSRDGINQLVLAMRKGSSGLKVHWQQAVEVPQDPSTNRDGSFGGVYTIRGIQKILPGSIKPIEYERIKTVTVKIESQSSRLDIDSRRIVSLVFVASDIRVDRQASM
ncbi:hypothetical protein AX16_009132 [Volvariella volvacea WC 439]|nr:hypothetical protein AX16_009132 [Volvariella volvacea WC 439]